ncbi:MAG: molecular chaperone TorD family protein [Planctomycetaceae bacterium]|jgi:DMSO reductase family type II enzyme chaperone|nr:molecular chaperone TorD family protein [Planctomycetaceae bacterium]
MNITANAITTIARQTIFRVTSLALMDPRSTTASGHDTTNRSELADQTLQQAAGAAAELLRGDRLCETELGPGERPLDQLDPSMVFERLPSSSDVLNAEYERTFGLLVGGSCPLHETEYLDERFTSQKSQSLADVAGYYRAFGLKPSPQQQERPDHVALELEFMATLAGLERQAAATDSEDQLADRCREAQRSFLATHLCWWLPAFTRLLEREHPDSFYTAVARLLSALMPAERARFGIGAFHEVARPRAGSDDESCSACPLTA